MPELNLVRANGTSALRGHYLEDMEQACCLQKKCLLTRSAIHSCIRLCGDRTGHDFGFGSRAAPPSLARKEERFQHSTLRFRVRCLRTAIHTERHRHLQHAKILLFTPWKTPTSRRRQRHRLLHLLSLCSHASTKCSEPASSSFDTNCLRFRGASSLIFMEKDGQRIGCHRQPRLRTA